MSKAAVDIPFIDDKKSPSSISSISGKDKSIQLKNKPIEKTKESVKSSNPRTSKISSTSGVKASDNKLTSRNVAKPNQKSIQVSSSKSPGKSLSDKSKLGARPQSSQEKLVRTTKIERPNTCPGSCSSTSTSATTPTTATAPQRSKHSPSKAAKDTVKAKANNVANKSKAINRTTTATTATTVVNKTTTKQLSNNKVDSKSQIKEPPQQQNTNKKNLVEKSLKEETTDLGLGGRNI